MSMLDQRLQVLVDRDRMERLRTHSKRSGAPVGELVRRAIDKTYPAEEKVMTPRQAADELLAMKAPPGREPDWEDQKQEMLDSRVKLDY